MDSFDGGSASKVDDVTALPSRHKMADMCYYGNVMTKTRWWLWVTMETLWQQQDGGYALLFYIFNSTVIDWTWFFTFFFDTSTPELLSEPVAGAARVLCNFVKLVPTGCLADDSIPTGGNWLRAGLNAFWRRYHRTATGTSRATDAWMTAERQRDSFPAGYPSRSFKTVHHAMGWSSRPKCASVSYS